MTIGASKNIAKVAIIVDRKNWAYDSIAKSLVKFNIYSDLELDIFYFKDESISLRKIYREYDLVFFLGWQLLKNIYKGKAFYKSIFIDEARTVTGIHSHHSWDDRKTTPDHDVIPSKKLINFLGSFKGINVVSRKLFEIFLETGLGNLAYTPNGVDTDKFSCKKKEIKTSFIIGYSGSDNHDWRKGITQFIIPASKIPGVNLKIASPLEGQISPDLMPSFYRDIDAYVCASSSEGFSLSVLEASAMGCPVISTRVGGCEDLIIDGYNGFLVDRNIDSIKEKIIYLKNNPQKSLEMGVNNKKLVEQLWSWKVRSRAWLSFIKGNL